MVAVFHRKLITWESLRQRMLLETEVFLEHGLANPDQQVVIPVVRVGQARFVRGFADLFWARLLESS